MWKKTFKAAVVAAAGASMLTAAPAEARYIIKFYENGQQVGEQWWCESGYLEGSVGYATSDYTFQQDYSFIC